MGRQILILAVAALASLVFSCPLPADETDKAKNIDQLLVSLSSPNQLVRRQTLIEIAKLKSGAEPAVETLCKLLGSNSFSERSDAMEALVAIGRPSVDPVTALIKSDSSVVRATALQTLGQLDSVSFADVKTLIDDADPRVRASLAIAIKGIDEKEPVELLIRMLTDEEPAVATQASISLKGKTDFSDSVVPALSAVLSRDEIASVVAEALASFGTDARSAVEHILNHRKKIGYRSPFTDITEETLAKIGPPDPADTKRIAELLNHNDADTTTMVANCISHLGEQGSEAASHLEETIERLLVRSKELQIAEAKTEHGILDEGDGSGDCWVASDACAAAHWSVTRNPRKFIALIEKISRDSETPAVFQDVMPWETFQPPTPWSTFPAEHIPLIAPLLRSDDANVVTAGLHAVSKLGPKATGLVDTVVEVAKRDIEFSWTTPTDALAAMGASVSEKSIPAILEAYRTGKIDLDDFAKALEQIGVGSQEIEQLLETQLDIDSSWMTAYCGQALCRISDDSHGAAASVIESKISARQKIEALGKLKIQPDVAIDFYISCMSHSDAWTRHYAIVEISNFRSQCSAAEKELVKLLEKETHRQTIFHARAALYLISGEKSQLEQFLKFKMQLPKKDKWHGVDVLKTIGALGPKGADFLHHILANKAWFLENNAQDFCKTLGKVGDRQSKTALMEIRQSKNYETKLFAERALKKIAAGEEGKN